MGSGFRSCAYLCHYFGGSSKLVARKVLQVVLVSGIASFQMHLKIQIQALSCFKLHGACIDGPPGNRKYIQFRLRVLRTP